MKSKLFAEVHVKRSSESVADELKIIWKGEEYLVPMVQDVEARITAGKVPTVTFTILGRLIENNEDE